MRNDVAWLRMGAEEVGVSGQTHFCSGGRASHGADDLGLFFFLFWPCLAACGILVPRPGMEPVPHAMAARSP